MFRNIKISAKITALIVVLSLLSVTAISVFTFRNNLEASQEKYNNNLSVVADGRADMVNHYFDNTIHSLKILQGSWQGIPADSLGASLANAASVYSFDDLIITNNHGSIIAAGTESRINSTVTDPDGTFYENAQKEIHFSTVKKDSSGYSIYVGAPFGDNLLVARLVLTPLFHNLEDVHGLAGTGETFLVQEDLASKKYLIVSPLRSDPGSFFKTITPGTNAAMPVNMAMMGKNGSGLGVDYRGVNVLSVWRKINGPHWALVAKMDADEINGEWKKLIETYVLVGICILLTAFALSMVFARLLVQPLNSMRRTLEMISKGELPEKNANPVQDEFGVMASKVDDLVQTLKKNAQFAQKVGEGKFDTEFKTAGENDTLGLSLINMRNDLIENEQREKERNWIVRGVAEVGEILRSHDSLDELGDDILQFIIGKISAVQGAFYVVSGEVEEKKIELRSSFAYSRKKYLKKEFRFAEGLVGQAAVEQDTVIRTEIPDEYVTITSGMLGEKKPTCILIVPLITNEEVFGVLEFAGFKKFGASQVKFVQELSLILARTIFNIKVNERTRKLLTESQEMSTELKVKTEVLRQNAEEMQATQEELKRSNIMLEEQVEEVNRTQRRMQLLLENASEVITIYEENGTIRYISPSVETILGYTQREMQGETDVDKVHADGKNVYTSMFTKMKDRPDGKVTVQFEYRTKDGNYIWLESTGTNCMSNPAIHGYILNSRDITERRRAELEQRMRSKMQALSENSPDLIARLEHDSISYINPVIESYTGQGPGSFLNKKVKETALDASVLESWLSIVEQVNASNDKVSAEMEFPSEMGKRVMQVNAIPEYDEKEVLESVLVVSHDITDRKLIELEIQNKNKKINDSINYAKRIQNAILPNTRLINKALPDSFILYKPRDVVSGDFPWFVQNKSDLFIAAVDCTGHGVPGALLSLIGYFLLNDIVKSRKVTDPGKILDLLDEGVTQTLRQDQDDSATKDGMDIALCRVNVETGDVEYAGAHRPMYAMKSGVMEEIKGNKFPIGGGIYKNQTNFTNTKIRLQKGDSFYFSSDGFPDQFGGPEGRKFGPKKVREIIENVHTMPMAEAAKVFDTEWESWRSDHKQTDDVLLIGIKF